MSCFHKNMFKIKYSKHGCVYHTKYFYSQKINYLNESM